MLTFGWPSEATEFVRLVEPFLVAQGLLELPESSIKIARLSGALRLDKQRVCKGPSRQPRKFERQLPIDGN